MGDNVSFTDIHVDDAIVDRVEDVLRSGRYVKGPQVEAFEDEFAAACGCEHAAAVSSGTAALSLSLRAAGVQAGSQVFVPGHTFFATASAVLDSGGRPVFVDIDPETYTIDPVDLERKVEAAERPDAVVPVHIYGAMADMKAVRAIAEAHGLRIVEDACQAHFASRGGRTAGTVGDAGAFSFYPSKNMTVAGDGGMVVTDDDGIATRVRELRNHGRDETGIHRELGVNDRLSEIQAAVGRQQLEHVRTWNEERAEAARRYTSRLRDLEPVTTPTEPAESTHVYHLYVIQVPRADRDPLRSHLADAGIETGIHYPTPAHEQPAVTERVGETTLDRTERLCDRIVSLPMHPRLEAADVDRVCDAIEAYFEEKEG